MKIPKLQTISFFGTVNASSNLTLVSKRITAAFKTKIVRASFAPGTNRLLLLRFFISPDPTAPTTAVVSGVNILAAIGHVNYITGDDEFKEFPHEVIQREAGMYLKVYAENTDGFSHTIDTQVTIEYIDEENEQ